MTAQRTIPEGLDCISSYDGLTIRRVWLSWKIAFFAVFAVFWDGFLFFWYRQALSKPQPDLTAIFFPVGHIAVGLGITYYVIASLINKTDVVVSSSGVRVSIGPAPWIGNKWVAVGDITSVIVRERSGNRGSKAHNVMYADSSLKERKLIAGLAESDQAEYIAAVIRDTLGLKSPNG